jgi:hypothetical protein
MHQGGARVATGDGVTRMAEGITSETTQFTESAMGNLQGGAAALNAQLAAWSATTAHHRLGLTNRPGLVAAILPDMPQADAIKLSL